MSNKNMKEFSKLSVDELKSKARELEESLFRDRMKKATGQLEDTASLWRQRKNLARVKGLMGQKSAQK